jgi:prefoldin alpha subunit
MKFLKAALQEVDHLTQAFTTLKQAESKFKSAMKSLNALPGSKGPFRGACSLPKTDALLREGSPDPTDQLALRPRAAGRRRHRQSRRRDGLLRREGERLLSLRVPLTHAKTVKEAKTYYNQKLLDLRTNIDQLRTAIEGKQENRQLMAQTIQRKAAQQQQQQAQGQAQAA